MSQRVLLINQYFPPDTAATAKIAALVAGALAVRHRVTVLAGRPSYSPTERHPAYLLRRQQVGGVVVERVGSTTSSRYRMYGRLANYFSYLTLAVPHALASKADLVLTMTDPPVVGIAGAFVAAARRLPFIYKIQDLYPDMAVATGLLRAGPPAAAWERLHQWALRRADRVVVVSEDMRERIAAKGIPKEHIVVVRDSGLTRVPTLPSTDHPVAQEVRNGWPFVVVHAGNLGFYGAWKTVVRAAALLEDVGAGFVFIGAGAAAADMRTMANSVSRVRFLPFRPASEVPHVLAAGDLHLVTVQRGLEGILFPGKLYGILAAGRPVLAVAPEGSEVVRIVRRYTCGFVADPDRPDAVAQAVREAMASPGRLAAMGARAREAARDFEQQGELDRFVGVVEDVLGGLPHRNEAAGRQDARA